MTGNHSFNVEVARRIGVNCAIVFQHIHYWCVQNKKGGRNAIEYEFTDDSDGGEKKVKRLFFWTFNSVREYQETFPYFTYDQIRRILEKLQKEGLLFSGVFNEIGYDRTKWYTVSPKGVNLLRDCLAAGVEETSVPMNHSSPAPGGKREKRHDENLYEDASGYNGDEEVYAKNFEEEDSAGGGKIETKDAGCKSGGHQLQPAGPAEKAGGNHETSWQKTQRELTKKTNRTGENARPIPNLNQNLKPNSNHLCTPSMRAGHQNARSPSLAELKSFCARENIKIDSDYFYNFYESVGWTVGARPVQNWKALVLAWARNPRNHAKARYCETPDGYSFRTVKISSGEVSEWKQV